MLQMATTYDLLYITLSTADRRFCATCPGYHTEFPVVNLPLAFLALACLTKYLQYYRAVSVKPKLFEVSFRSPRELLIAVSYVCAL